MVLPVWFDKLSDLPELYDSRNEEKNSSSVNKVCEIIDSATDEDDRISVYGNWDIIYVLSNRMHATRYSYQFPVGTVKPEILDAYFEELEEQPPTLIILRVGDYDERIRQYLDTHAYSLIYEETREDGERGNLARIYSEN